METNSNESLSVHSFLVKSDMESNKYFAIYMLESQFEV